MQEIGAISALQPESIAARHRLSARWLFLVCAVVLLMLLALVPPLVSINRYQRRIATSMGMSLGRPVHFDHVALNLLPLPSFTINNFVVEEDPAFGSEPTIRANTVNARLRVSSLWRRRVEITRISFAEPSINLVHDQNGRWNLSGVLSRASRIEAAPTGQARAGAAPRFPYIEATGARINLKEGAEKTPFSLNEADLALWLPSPQEFRLRLQAHPIRTDTSVSDTGSVQIEATVGRAEEVSRVPLTIQGAWRGAPMGQASRLFTAKDMGLRGDLSLTASITGTLARSEFQTRLRINGLRRSDFVPEHELTIDTECTGTVSRVFHALDDFRCGWVVPDSDGARVAVAGSVPDIRQLDATDLEIGTSRLPASVLLNWMRVMSARIPGTLTATGLLSGSFAREKTAGGAGWNGEVAIPELRLSGAMAKTDELTLAQVMARANGEGSSLQPARWQQLMPDHVLIGPTLVPLGGRDPVVLDGSVSLQGYSLHLTGTALPSRLADLGEAIPQIGDGLAAVLPAGRAPVRVDLTARRTWDGDQVWTDNLAHQGPRPPARPGAPARKTVSRERPRG